MLIVVLFQHDIFFVTAMTNSAKWTLQECRKVSRRSTRLLLVGTFVEGWALRFHLVSEPPPHRRHQGSDTTTTTREAQFRVRLSRTRTPYSVTLDEIRIVGLQNVGEVRVVTSRTRL